MLIIEGNDIQRLYDIKKTSLYQLVKFALVTLNNRQTLLELLIAALI